MTKLLCTLLTALTLAITSTVVLSATPPGPGSATEATGAAYTIGIDEVPFIFDIVADPSEPGSVLLATRAGLYRARPDGTAERISRQPNRLWSLSLDHPNALRLYARGIADDGRSGGVLVSNDHGRTWQGLSSPGQAPRNLRVIESSKAAPKLVYGADYRFWRSTDDGLNWESTGGPASRIIDLAASANDAQRIFAATRMGLHVSDDGGMSWRPVGGAPCRLPVTAVDTGRDGVVYAFSLCAGLVRGDERNGSWTVVNDDFGGCIVQHLAVDPANSGRLYAVIGCNKLLFSTDGGVSWLEFGSLKEWEPDCPTNPPRDLRVEN